ncbi:MAG: ribosome-associated translation inhibitor RaiA [Sulfurimonas sp.]|uniref:ribosome hibernation-promoting factor, HPF/YfiA family n=1 Tax=Sulfurimonas sp. TaxID=2022749 RepID=UPI0026044BB8|nr:ribosome-associated translation inhibitor RaiA [Sulfurimonas sp.]MDD2652471.1 ribosome-associated translation inhibitor RaiA [Sulfurimonas sp.]MDD3452208.1 ribosome-associated translation inhibitor RaiA [Sulfurimonas sp.]
MNISLTGRHIELTDAIKAHMQASIETLSKYNMDIISVSIIASAQTKKGKEHSRVEFVINLAHKNSIVIEQGDQDLYAAIDLATSRAQKAMRRMHDKDNGHHKDGINDAKSQANESINLHELSEAMEDEIVPVALELYKPREVEDVLNDLKENKKLFEIFIDNDGKTRVLYKRNDGKFGLY